MSSPPSPGQVAAASSPEPSHADALTVLGQRLRRAREASGLNTADLAERLRIGVEQLEALEAADSERLPERVFVIAQARRVAGALNLDISPELEALRASEAAAAPARRGAPSPSRRVGTPVGAAGTARAGKLAAEPGSPGGASPVRRPLLWSAGALILLGALWGAWQVRSLQQGGQQQSGRDRSEPASGALATPARQPAPTPSASVAPADGQGSAAGTAAPPQPTAGSVVLASREPSWVEVRRPDGSIVFRGLLRGSRVFALDKGLQVLAGRPDLVTTRIGAAPPQVLGPISDVRWRSLPGAR